MIGSTVALAACLAAPAPAWVAAVRGPVTVLRASGDEEPAQTGISLAVGDRLRCGDGAVSKALVGERNLVTLGAASELGLVAHYFDVELNRYESSVRLYRGRARFVAGAFLEAPTRFEVHTPHSVVASRGWVGVVEAAALRDTIFVEDGQASVLGQAEARRSVKIEAGQHVAFGVEGMLISPQAYGMAQLQAYRVETWLPQQLDPAVAGRIVILPGVAAPLLELVPNRPPPAGVRVGPGLSADQPLPLEPPSPVVIPVAIHAVQ